MEQKEKDAQISIFTTEESQLPETNLLGKTIDLKYEVISLAGKGSWGSVYKARHATLHHNVAMKVLHQHVALDTDSMARFQQEAMAAIRVSHPNVCRVFDFGVLPDGLPYLIMEYLEGTTISEILREQGSIDVDAFLPLLQQIASGLDAIHAKGIIHRDVKPANIILTDNLTTIKLLDFGLAKLSDDNYSEVHTATGQTLGTPLYMSPEQCGGRSLDQRSDVYSLASVTYEVLTGQHLFHCNSLFELLNAHINQDPNLDLPPLDAELKLVFLKALAKKSADRHASAGEFAESIAEARTQRSSPVSRLKLLLHGVSQSTRNVGLPVVLCSLLAVCSVFFGFLFYQRESPDQTYKSDMAEGRRQAQVSDYKAAARSYEQAAQIAAQFSEGDDRQYAAIMEWRAVLSKMGRTSEADQLRNRLNLLESKYVELKLGNAETNAKRMETLSHQNIDLSNARELARLRNNQAQLMLKGNRLEEALFQLNKALELEMGEYKKDLQDELATTMSNMAYVSFQSKNFEQSEVQYKEALSLREMLFGANHPLVSKSLRNLGDFYLKTRRPAEAVTSLSRALKIDTGLHLPVEIAWDENSLGLAMMRADRRREARNFLQSALEMRNQLYGPKSLDSARSLYSLGLVEQSDSHWTEASKYFNQALLVFDLELPINSPETTRCLQSLGEVNLEKGNIRDAATVLTRLESILGANDAAVLQLKQRLSRRTAKDK